MKLRRGRPRIIAILFYCFIVLGATFLFFTETSYADDVEAVISGDIIINEIYPNPDPESCSLDWCKNEWIELVNLSDEDIVLAGYTIEDLNIFNDKIDDPGNYNPTELNGFTVSAKSLLLLEKKDSLFTLNNDNEKIILRKNDDVIDEFSYGTVNGVKQLYPAPAKGQSYAFFGADGWKVTASPTSGVENIFTDPKADGQEEDNYPINIAVARNESNGEEVTITGTVTVLPGVLSSQYFYIQDATSGMQIYSYYKSFPALNIGDVIQVSGELSETSGERRLKMGSDTVVNIISHIEPPPPKQVEIKDIGESLEGQYVKISGTVAETSGDTFVIQDNENNQIKIVIKSMTNIDKPKMYKGDQVEISGIVSQYKDEYRILPTKQDDVKIISSMTSALPEAGLPLFFYPIFSFIIVSLWNTFQKVKRKLLRSQKKSWPRHLPATFLP